MTPKRKSGGKKTDQDRSEIGGGIFSSLTDFLGNLGDLAEAGERLSRKQAAGQDRGDKGGAAEVQQLPHAI